MESEVIAVKKRWILVTVAVVVLLVALGVGFASAARTTPPTQEWWNQMHNSPAMRQMHAQMPAELQAQCDALHAQMGTMMGNGQTGPGMMGNGQTGPGMMGSGGAGMMGNGGMMGR